jgi:hypothetical protein
MAFPSFCMCYKRYKKKNPSHLSVAYANCRPD